MRGVTPTLSANWLLLINSIFPNNWRFFVLVFGLSKKAQLHPLWIALFGHLSSMKNYGLSKLK